MRKSTRRTSYEKYFEGYTSYKDPQTGKIKRMYTGDYYCSTLPEPVWKKRKILYAVLFAASVLVWLVASLSDYGNLGSLITAVLSICIAADVMGLLLELIYVFYFCTAPRKMTIQKYKEASINLKRASCFAMIVLFASAGAEVLSFLVNLSSLPFRSLLIALCYLLAGIASAAIRRMESQTTYTRIPGTKQPPDASENKAAGNPSSSENEANSKTVSPENGADGKTVSPENGADGKLVSSEDGADGKTVSSENETADDQAQPD